MHRRLLTCVLAALGFAAPAPAATGANGMPDSWYFYNGRHPSVGALRELEGRPAPELKLRGWIGDAVTLESLRGKIVVVDFWATWCGPCMRAIPKNVQLQEKYRDQGVVFIGIHDADRGSGAMPAAAGRLHINYPVAIDDGGVSTKAWRVRFWPTYAVIDRDGKVAAAGLLPDHIEDALLHLLDPGSKIDPTELAASGADVPALWLEGDERTRHRLVPLENAAALPAITSGQWINTEPLDADDLRGKIVLLDFWATWCPPCLAAIKNTNALHERYRDRGLVIIGVCHPRGGENMAQVAKQYGIEYPICLDEDGSLVSGYLVNGFPDYYFLDRDGTMAAADCENNRVEEVIRMLLPRGAKDAE